MIAKLEGPAVSQYCALRLLQVDKCVSLLKNLKYSLPKRVERGSLKTLSTWCRQHWMNLYMNLLESWYPFRHNHKFLLSRNDKIIFIHVNCFRGSQVRFLLRSGREYEQSTTDSDRLSPRFLDYFLFRSSYRKQSLDKR